jgi:hypothetical protein
MVENIEAKSSIHELSSSSFLHLDVMPILVRTSLDGAGGWVASIWIDKAIQKLASN